MKLREKLLKETEIIGVREQMRVIKSELETWDEKVKFSFYRLG